MKTDLESLKIRMKEYALQIGIHKIGVTHAEPFEEERVQFLKQKENGWATGFEESDIEKRVNPKYSLEDAASIIAIAIAYPSQFEMREPRQEDLTGQFCASSWGHDYHKILQEKLYLLQQFLEENVPNVHIKQMVDTGALSDRAVAKRAGLGFIGKNGALITEEYGSFVYLGEMLTNLPFSPDAVPDFLDCGTCDKCMKACPAKAIVGPAQINGQRCLSYVTQKKSILTDDEKEKLGRRIYGCDTCQNVCPKNKIVLPRVYDAHFIPDPELTFPKLSTLYGLTNRQFKETYGHMAGAWRGRTPIQRNVVIIAGRRKDFSSYPYILKMFQDDPRVTIRETACWALGKYISVDIYQEEIVMVLKQRLAVENEADVLQAIDKVMKQYPELF